MPKKYCNAISWSKICVLPNESSVRCLTGTENDPHQDSSSLIKILKVSGQAHEEVMEKKAKVKQNCPGDLMARDGGRHCGYRHRQTHLNPVYPRFIYNLTSHQLAVRPSHSVSVLLESFPVDRTGHSNTISEAQLTGSSVER